MSKSMVLRICKVDMSSYNGFVWPKNGRVVAPDWKNDNQCGNGLHGWFEGQGDASCSNYTHLYDAKYLVLEVDTETIINLHGKCKFPEAEVVFVGNGHEALSYIERTYTQLFNAPLLFATRFTGDNGTAMVGDYGTAMVGDYGIATAGDYGTATAGDYGTATAGDYGTATAGDNGIATAGNNGTAMAGDYGIAMAGDKGVIQITYFDKRGRIVTGYIGENSLLANTKYKLNDKHSFIEAI